MKGQKPYQERQEDLLLEAACRERLRQTGLAVSAEAAACPQEKKLQFQRRLERLERKKRRKMLPKAAALFLAVFITGLAASNIPAAAIYTYLNRVITFISEQVSFFSSECPVDVVDEHTGLPHPGYIPDGFTFKTGQTRGDITVLRYEQGDDSIEYRVYPMETEAASDIGEEVQLNGQRALITNHENTTSLIWNDADHKYILEGTLPAEELIRIAQSVH